MANTREPQGSVSDAAVEFGNSVRSWISRLIEPDDQDKKQDLADPRSLTREQIDKTIKAAEREKELNKKRPKEEQIFIDDGYLQQLKGRRKQIDSAKDISSIVSGLRNPGDKKENKPDPNREKIESLIPDMIRDMKSSGDKFDATAAARLSENRAGINRLFDKGVDSENKRRALESLLESNILKEVRPEIDPNRDRLQKLISAQIASEENTDDELPSIEPRSNLLEKSIAGIFAPLIGAAIGGSEAGAIVGKSGIQQIKNIDENEDRLLKRAEARLKLLREHKTNKQRRVLDLAKLQSELGTKDSSRLVQLVKTLSELRGETIEETERWLKLKFDQNRLESDEFEKMSTMDRNIFKDSLSALVDLKNSTGIDDSKRFDMGRKLMGDLDKNKHYKDFRERTMAVAMFNKLNKMKNDRGTVTGPASVAMIFAFMRALDPDSVVREGEQATIRSTKAVENFWPSITAWLQGGKLEATQISEMRRALMSIAKPAIERGAQVYRRHQRIANEFGIDPDLWFDPLREEVFSEIIELDQNTGAEKIGVKFVPGAEEVDKKTKTKSRRFRIKRGD